MGADIHMVLERRVKLRDVEKWVGVNAFPYIIGSIYTGDGAVSDRVYWHVDRRNYNLFADLAGVRGDGPEPKGVPDDASDLALVEIDEWGGDGHSHTWLTLDEAIPIFLLNGSFGDAGVAVLKAMQNGSTEKTLRDYLPYFWSDSYDEFG